MIHEIVNPEGRVRGKNLYAQLILVAESHFLGLVRKALSKETSSKVLTEVEKGWAHLSGTEFLQAVSTVLSEQATMGPEERAV